MWVLLLRIVKLMFFYTSSIPYYHVETLTTGDSDRQLHERGVGQMATMREFFFRRFGAGQPEVVKERERVYLLGLPNSSGERFPLRRNIEDKLNSLEEEREYLLDLCPWINRTSTRKVRKLH